MATRRPGQQPESAVAERADTTGSMEASWPWACLRCDATVFHDVLYCRECRPAATRAAEGGRGRGRGDGPFRSWIRRQSYPRFLGTVTSVAGIELALTAFWLEVMLVGPANLPLLSAF